MPSVVAVEGHLLLVAARPDDEGGDGDEHEHDEAPGHGRAADPIDGSGEPVARLARAARERRPRAAAAVLALEDVAQAAHRLLELALHPAAGAEGLQELVGGGLGLGQQREAHARGARGPLLEVVDAERADAVELAPAPGLADAPRALELDHRRVAPGEAVERHLQAEARAGAVAVGVLARQPPVDHEVIVELGVVGDVGEVLEDLLARTGDHDLDAHGIHGAGVYPRPVRRPGAGRCARARSGARPRSARAGPRGAGRHRSQMSAPSREAVDALADQRRAPAVLAGRARPAASAPTLLRSSSRSRSGSEMPSRGRNMAQSFAAGRPPPAAGRSSHTR